MHIAGQCVMILPYSYLTGYCVVSFAPNTMINALAYFVLSPRAWSISALYGNREGLIHLNHIRVQQDVAEDFSSFCFFVSAYALYLFTSKLEDGCGSPASLSHHTTHTHWMTHTHSHRNMQTHDNAGQTTWRASPWRKEKIRCTQQPHSSLSWGIIVCVSLSSGKLQAGCLSGAAVWVQGGAGRL